MYAPHVSGAPHEIVETVLAALDAGASGVMFSETYAGGAVRMVREATRHLADPPAIYGHNAGVGVKTRSIWREVIDFLARLDGIDGDCMAQACLFAALSELVNTYGEDATAKFATGLSERIANGEVSLEFARQ